MSTRDDSRTRQQDAELRTKQRAILSKLAEANRLTKEAVLAEAKRTDSPLHDHPAFDWDVNKAAERQWLTQARRVIQEFNRECVIERGRIVQAASAGPVNIKRGHRVKVRDFHALRVGAELPSGTTVESDDGPEEDTEEPERQKPQKFAALDDMQDDRELKVKAAATFFRTLRGFRGQCYLYEDVEKDFLVIAQAIDRISARLEGGAFGVKAKGQPSLMPVAGAVAARV